MIALDPKQRVRMAVTHPLRVALGWYQGHLSPRCQCGGWALLAGILGLSLTAYAQDGTNPIPAGPTWHDAIEMAKLLGLPGVAAVFGWIANSKIGQGVPVKIEGTVTTSLDAEDRVLIEKLVQNSEEMLRRTPVPH